MRKRSVTTHWDFVLLSGAGPRFTRWLRSELCERLETTHVEHDFETSAARAPSSTTEGQRARS